MRPVESSSCVDGQAFLHACVELGDLRVTHKSYTHGFEQHWHEHPEASIDLVLDGGGIGSYAGTEIRAAPGVVGFFASQLRHRFRADPGGVRSMHIAIPDSVLDEDEDFREVACAELEHTRAIGLATRLYQELRCRDRSSEIEIESLCFELLGEVRGTLAIGRGRAPWIDEAIAFLQESVDYSPSLTQLASLLGVSRSHFTRAFRASIGCTPGAYHRGVRVAAAARLIARGESIARAAMRTGFTDQAHLTRVFSSHLGLTPARFRAAIVDH